MKKNIILILIFLILGLSSFFIWQGIYLPKDIKITEEKIFSIERGKNFFQISENLEKEGLIKSKFLFNFYVILRGSQGKLQAGEYFLSPSMSVSKIAQKIISGDIAKVTITIPEGFTVKEIERKLNLKLPGENLEGFLFPDTYSFPLNISGKEVVAKMRENFDRKITTELKKEIERQGKTIFEIITMASLIQEEVKTKEDKKIVSGILWKRLEIGMPLQIDATIVYLLEKKGLMPEEGWTFREMLREVALGRKIDSPYNTYKYLGLPPGPICNPGLESIIASVYPIDSDYLYYLSTPEGKTIFSRNLKEHNIAKRKYLR